jgi:hypothetical protein
MLLGVGLADFVRKPYARWEIFEVMAWRLAGTYFYQDHSAAPS